MLKDIHVELRKRPGTGAVGDYSGEWNLPAGRTPCDNDEGSKSIILIIYTTEE